MKGQRSYPDVMKFCGIALLLLTATGGVLSAVTLKDFSGLSPRTLRRLTAGEIVVSDSVDQPEVVLLPNEAWIALDRTGTCPDRTGFYTEALSYIPYPQEMSQLSADLRTAALLDTLRAVSTQEGITYISYRRGDKPAVLISRSFVTDRVGSRRRLPDPVVDGVLPPKISDIVFQSDTSFFGNYYQYDYTIGPDVIMMNMQNRTTLSVFGIVPAIRKDQYTASAFVQQLDEGVLVYSFAEIVDRDPVVSILGYEVHLPSAINRRWTAVHEWFRSQLMKR